MEDKKDSRRISDVLRSNIQKKPLNVAKIERETIDELLTLRTMFVSLNDSKNRLKEHYIRKIRYTEESLLKNNTEYNQEKLRILKDIVENYF